MIGIFLKDSIRPNHDSKDFDEIMIGLSRSYGSVSTWYRPLLSQNRHWIDFDGYDVNNFRASIR